MIAAFNVAVLSVFLLALWHRLNDAERIAQFAFVLLGVFFTLEIAATVVRRVREWWLSRPRSDLTMSSVEHRYFGVCRRAGARE